jgi:ABC-type Zn uptake system ZnuABC Zn-binding protein ZnuA
MSSAPDPSAYAAERVGGRRVEVAKLTPAGAEPHDLELTPDQIDDVLDADLVVDLGRNFQPAVERAAAQQDGLTVQLLDALPIKAANKGVDESDAEALDPREHVTVIFTEGLVSPRVAQTLEREVGVHTDTLNPLEGLTKAEQQSGANYVNVMDDNLARLRTALGCR